MTAYWTNRVIQIVVPRDRWLSHKREIDFINELAELFDATLGGCYETISVRDELVMGDPEDAA